MPAILFMEKCKKGIMAEVISLAYHLELFDSHLQVRPYPRRAFSDGESTLTLNELGLTSKQEALFLEQI